MTTWAKGVDISSQLIFVIPDDWWLLFRGDSCGDRLSRGDRDHHCVMGRRREGPWLCHSLRCQSKTSLNFEILFRVASSGFWTRTWGGRGAVKTDWGPVPLHWAGGGVGCYLQLHHLPRVHRVPGQHHWARHHSPCPDLTFGISYTFKIYLSLCWCLLTSIIGRV